MHQHDDDPGERTGVDADEDGESAASFTVGVPASYTLSVQNTGTAATTAVTTITDTIPTGLTIGTLPAGCTAAGQTVTCTIAAGLAVSGDARAS